MFAGYEAVSKSSTGRSRRHASSIGGSKMPSPPTLSSTFFSMFSDYKAVSKSSTGRSQRHASNAGDTTSPSPTTLSPSTFSFVSSDYHPVSKSSTVRSRRLTSIVSSYLGLLNPEDASASLLLSGYSTLTVSLISESLVCSDSSTTTSSKMSRSGLTGAAEGALFLRIWNLYIYKA